MASIWKRLGEGPNRRYERQDKAPDIIHDLITKTNLDTNTINDLIKSYVNEGITQLPNMVQEGFQGPLEQGQSRETPTNSLRQPAYVYDETSNQFNRAPEGVSEPLKQIRELNRFRNNSTAPRGNWYMDENGKWQRWESDVPDKTPRETSVQTKERLAIESAITQLKNKKAVKKMGTTQYEEPITTRDQALSVPVGLGLDPDRYPAIKEVLSSYPETLPEEPKQPTFWDDLGGSIRSAANAIGRTGSEIGRRVHSMVGGQSQNEVPVQPRKQEVTNPEEYLRSIRAKITPANIEWAKRKLGAK